MKFDKAYEIGKKGQKVIEDFLEKEKKVLIQAFINFYGEEYKIYIENVINNINFIYFMSDVVYKDYKKEALNDFNLYNYLIAYCEEVIHQTRLLPVKEREKFLRQKLILGASNPKGNIKECFPIDNLLEGMVAFHSEIIKGEEKKVITLCVLAIDTIILIHEINHALNTKVLAISPDNIYYNMPFNSLIDELINEYMSLEIYEEYKKLGGEDIKALPTFKHFIAYDYYLYLIEPFYNTFKALIKTGLITHNDLYIQNNLGKETLNKYGLLVKEIVEKDLDGCLKEEDIQELNLLLEEMIDNYLGNEERKLTR